MQLLREIVVDNFAGGGGASTGIELAIGRSVDIAMTRNTIARVYGTSIQGRRLQGVRWRSAGSHQTANTFLRQRGSSP
jgi:hypothetical protein